MSVGLARYRLRCGPSTTGLQGAFVGVHRGFHGHARYPPWAGRRAAICPFWIGPIPIRAVGGLLGASCDGWCAIRCQHTRILGQLMASEVGQWSGVGTAPHAGAAFDRVRGGPHSGARSASATQTRASRLPVPGLRRWCGPCAGGGEYETPVWASRAADGYVWGGWLHAGRDEPAMSRSCRGRQVDGSQGPRRGAVGAGAGERGGLRGNVDDGDR